YGAISEQRADLVAAAMANASAKHGTTFPPQQVFVVGDTPADVRAARQHGAVAVGVATGRHSEDELRAAGAAVVFADLSDTQAVLDTLNRATGASSW
ncbi:MAG: HAD family hydrolase, partial [Sciscionella sp.]